ncbi:FtsK/SpoIIIE domain-containing protein [Candidatus Merdisoma sp. HCP28S3_D10]|uniref:FtsK/SpoIIIE domain-containing protein n=1 Tax=unclassified Candidatus Merdisoma TaxID=3099611 RepID=UPI003F8B62B9
MIDKQSLVIGLLIEKMADSKVGILAKGIDDIQPDEIAVELSSQRKSHVYIAAVGYGISADVEEAEYTLTPSIEKAVLWRSFPEYAGSIVVFIKTDTDKLHSLAEFDVISLKDVSKYLLEQQITNESNTPTQNFWRALQQTSDYYPFEAIMEFVQAVSNEGTAAEAIPNNMWRLNLLCDADILGTKYKSDERLTRNRELIFAIGQLSEDSRKKLSRSLARTKGEDRARLQNAYNLLQNLYKYGNRDTLRQLDFATVQDLFSASKANESKKKKKNPPKTPEETGIDTPDVTSEAAPIRPKELGQLISDAIVNGDEEDTAAVKELLEELKKHFDPETEENNDSIPTISGVFDDRTIVIENHQSDLRKLVGTVCNETAWGGLMETEESVLKDAISADIKSFSPFNPVGTESMVAFHGGIDGSQSLFDFITQFDAQFKAKNIETAEMFIPIIEELLTFRGKLLSNLDMIMYYPVLSFGVDEESRQTLIGYIEAWAKLYHAFSINEPVMREMSPSSTSFIARALLLLDVLYVKTPKEWKAILLPLHPIFLWRYYEIFKTLPSKKAQLSEDDATALTAVLTQLPQILSFVIANSIVTETSDDKVLPCSGNIEMLPTFENKTNRYLGDDGTQSIGEILTRWIGFAPYTKNEIRICSVDAPDLIANIRAIKSFMDKNGCERVVYDVYLTRKQNGNTELSKLDYSGKDYEIGEFIRQNKIAISIRNVESASEVKTALSEKPVHVAFYFDQSAYAIEFGPNNKNLYINPLVVTYDYDFDEIQHRGSIFPSSEMDSGLIGDYHKLMKSADVISNNMNPRTTYNGSTDMTAVVSTIQEGMVQWLVAADRDTNNYDPHGAIPIGEMQYDRRMVNVWASSDSRIITQYLTMLRAYNLYPKPETLIGILKNFGHIASNGLISIPKFGADAQAIDNKKKGLIGTLFAASWYTRNNENSLVASLDDDKARLWLQDSRFGNERADLVGLKYIAETNTLLIQPIEVKTRDESPDATITKGDDGRQLISGHAAGQIASIVGMLKEIFFVDENSSDMFISARREVLKYQIVSECFRNVHDSEWQKRWCAILKKAFGNGASGNINIQVSGLLMHIKLSEVSGGKVVQCVYADADEGPIEYRDCPIEYRLLSAKEIQQEVLGEGTVLKETLVADYDSDEVPEPNEEGIVIYEFGNPSYPMVAEQQSKYKAELQESVANVVSVQTDPVKMGVSEKKDELKDASIEEIEQLVKDFKRSCGDYHVSLRECEAKSSVVGPSVIRLKFKLGRGQSLQGLASHLEDIGREMKRTGVIIQQVPNSDELLLDVPRLHREKVLFKDVISSIPAVTSPEQLFFPLGRTPNGKDLIEDLSQMPHMLVGGSTGSGKSVFLFTMLASMLMTHPKKEDMQLILSSSKLEDFIHFDGLPHLYSGRIISDATEATKVIKEVIFEESERRGRLLAEARVANIIEYNKKVTEKLAPIVVVIDEFADLADQLETTKEKNAFYKPVQRIAQAGRSRGIHLVICTQRPEAKLVPSTTKAQLNGRVALRVNDGISSRMIIEEPDAQYLQKHGDMIYRNGDIVERAQGYLIEIEELDKIVDDVIHGRI